LPAKKLPSEFFQSICNYDEIYTAFFPKRSTNYTEHERLPAACVFFHFFAIKPFLLRRVVYDPSNKFTSIFFLPENLEYGM
jgi:hypothetical protein